MPPTRKRKSLEPAEEEKEEEEKEIKTKDTSKVKEKEKEKEKAKEENEKEKEKAAKKKKALERKKKNKLQTNDDDNEEEITTKKPKKKQKEEDGEEGDSKQEVKSDSKVDDSEKKNKEILDSIVWEWAGDSKTGSQDRWIKYADKVTLSLESAFQLKEKELKLDAERYVDLVTMMQRRYDDPNKRRLVQRFKPDLTLSFADVAMTVHVLSYLVGPPDINVILSALGQKEVDAEERKKWTEVLTVNTWTAYELLDPPASYSEEVFKLASNRVAIKSMLRVPIMLNVPMLTKCLAQVYGTMHSPKTPDTHTDYDHSKLTTFYNSKAMRYKSDPTKDDLDSRGNVKGDEYDLGKDGAFKNFVVLIGIFATMLNEASEISGNLTPLLEKKGFSVIVCNEQSSFMHNLNFADVAIIINSDDMWKETYTKLLQFQQKGGGLGIFVSNISHHPSELTNLLNHFKVYFNGSSPAPVVVKRQTVSGIVNLAGCFIDLHPLTAGLNQLFAGGDKRMCLSLKGGAGGPQPVAQEKGVFHTSTLMAFMEAKLVSGSPNGRVFFDGDTSKLSNNFNLAGVDRFVSNVVVWLLGLDFKLKNNLKMYGRLTLQNFPTMPPYKPYIAPLIPSGSPLPTLYSGPILSTSSSSPYTSLPTMSSLPYSTLSSSSSTPPYITSYPSSMMSSYSSPLSSTYQSSMTGFGSTLGSQLYTPPPYPTLSSSLLSSSPYSTSPYSTPLSTYNNLPSSYASTLSPFIPSPVQNSSNTISPMLLHTPSNSTSWYTSGNNLQNNNNNNN